MTGSSISSGDDDREAFLYFVPKYMEQSHSWK